VSRQECVGFTRLVIGSSDAHDAARDKADRCETGSPWQRRQPREARRGRSAAVASLPHHYSVNTVVSLTGGTRPRARTLHGGVGLLRLAELARVEQADVHHIDGRACDLTAV